MYCDCILPLPLESSLTYSVPAGLFPQVGQRVFVPLGRSKHYIALVVRLHDVKPEYDTKDIIEVMDDAPIVIPSQMSLWRWIADYYACSLGEVFKAAIPSTLKKYVKPKARRRSSADLPLETSPMHALSDVQQQALEQIKSVWRSQSTCLLHGVTSSGKTEIYIHLIDEAIRQGRQVLYLLPEIVLTTQLSERLRSVFGSRLGIYHSKYSDAQRVEVYRKQLSDEPYDIIVGVRSSVLLPFRRLGLVIVDEEHETSFKQQDPAPRYNARNVALMMAASAGAKTLLGSATPSLESYDNARKGKYGLVKLLTRYEGLELPEVEVVDMKEEIRRKTATGLFSSRLLAEVRRTLEDGYQTILFQNRRGYSPLVECKTCGWVPQCPRCDVSLTFHKRLGRLSCHYCGYTTEVPALCPQCETESLRTKGFGTERVEDTLSQIFPEARIQRMDLDTTRSRSSYEKIIDDFQEGRTDILVGTQMVAKGLDFANVRLVGILDASAMLRLPDFRAHERGFQLMAQVAGRAGRHAFKGKVILQTKEASSDVIGQVVRHDYEAMFLSQSEERQCFFFPPFCRLMDIYLKHKDEHVVEHMAEEMSALLRQVFGERVLGPMTPPVARMQSLHILKLSLKVELTANPILVVARLREVIAHVKSKDAFRSATVTLDVDPL